MKSRFLSPPALAGSIVALVFGGLMLGPFMHETDQAWLLDGSIAIVKGQWDAARLAFMIDKQYISYLLPAALFHLFPRPLNADTLVATANIFGFSLFWGTLVWLLARSHHRLSLSLVLPVILAPAFLVHSPFYASAFTSVSAIFILARFLDRKSWQVWHRVMVFFLAFGAVGARADALLLLPLLAMLHSPRRRFISVLQSPNTWLMALGGILALMAGRFLIGHGSVDFATWHFLLKLLAAYLLFGMGGAGLLLLVIYLAILRMWPAARCRLWLVFLAAALTIPAVYYSWQLLSPRHCVVGVTAVLVFVCARSGRVMFQLFFRSGIFTTAIKGALILMAVVPVIIGVNMDTFTSPRLTLLRPTLFPTVAGVCPMGAYLGHAFHVRRSDGFLDHNQAVWAAAKQTIFQPDPATGQVEVISTPMESYLELSAHLQEFGFHRVLLTDSHLPSEFFIDSRSLLRFQFVWPGNLVLFDSFFPGTLLSPATKANWHGITILRGQPNRPATAESFNAILWVMNGAFHGDEFRLETATNLYSIPADWAGKKLVLASRHDFTVTPSEKITSANFTNDVLGDWHVCEISPVRPGEKFELRGATPSGVNAAVSALPEWMSLRKY